MLGTSRPELEELQSSLREEISVEIKTLIAQTHKEVISILRSENEEIPANEKEIQQIFWQSSVSQENKFFGLYGFHQGMVS